MTEDQVSPRMRKMLEKGREKARKSVIDRGLVQFRADPVMMQMLLETSERRGIPLGTMLREWVKERLFHEERKTEEIRSLASLCVDLGNKLDALQKSFVEGTVPPALMQSLPFGQITGHSHRIEDLVVAVHSLYGVETERAKRAADIYLRKATAARPCVEAAVIEDVHVFEMAAAIAAIAEGIEK